ncbi:MAG: sensor histidine kinase [Pyrinomonadaceae bacterium]
MEQNPTQNRRWIKWPWIALGWTIFACFFASQVIVSRAYAGRPLNVGRTVFVWLICSYVWLVLTPLVLYLARRFAFERRSWTKNLLLHLAASIGFAFLQIAIYFSVASLLALIFNTVPPETFRSIFVSEFHFDLLTYWGIIGLAHALDYYRKYREREIRASQLEARLARAQLDALKMQLHPHFLFNTLNTISVLMQEDVTVANRLLLRLSDLLRMALNTTDAHEVPLRQEMEFLRSYLEIEQTRFQDRLTVHLDIDAEASEAQVPNLILQPLVENAIRYAVAPRATKSTIEIRAARFNGQIKLQVRDDGPGISEAQKANDLPGIGLRNTRSRLEKLYGEAHRFDLSTPEGGGLQVTIMIPFHTGNGDREGSHGEHSDADR